jgi:AraC-like DNA-binding protein
MANTQTAAPALLLSRFPAIHATSPEEIHRAHDPCWGRLRCDPADLSRPFGWLAHRAPLGALTLRASQFRCDTCAETDAVQDCFAVVLPLASRGDVSHAGSTTSLVPEDSGLVISPGLPLRASLRADFQDLQLHIPSPLLHASLGALTGARPKGPLQFAPRLALQQEAAAGLARTLRFVAAELERPKSLLSSPVVATSLADALLSQLLLGQPHTHSDLLRQPARATEPGYVRQVEDYIVANATEPLSLSDLARVTGVHVRSIQAGFRAHRGCSPTAFLREQRLLLARTRLLSAPSTSVAQIALECGFEHLGRFSLSYRARFGERPSDTLRRTRGEDPALRQVDKGNARPG